MGGYFVGFFLVGKKVVCVLGVFDFLYFCILCGLEIWDIMVNGDCLFVFGFFD